ncbi:hypothetical protein NDU88_005180 [Pleurodeles waltl]|uniref:Uncharacterized protein n=1 Tax=Pleurodeles waltl TaxID=8319 RepID=A0AAV7W743_PLEWA|nr:hypothetical protein NDU88_005180 [Pleurodeles waltl]
MIGARHSCPALHNNDARTYMHKVFTKRPRLPGQLRVRRVPWWALQSSVSQATREDAESEHKEFTGELAHVTHKTTNRKVPHVERRSRFSSKSLLN